MGCGASFRKVHDVAVAVPIVPVPASPRSPLRVHLDIQRRVKDEKEDNIHEAALAGKVSFFEVLRVEPDTDINSPWPDAPGKIKGATPLVLAAWTGKAEVVRILLEMPGVDVNATTNDVDKPARCGQTALHWAARSGHASVVKVLLQDLRVDVTLKTGSKMTAFILAGQEGHTDVLKEFLSVRERLDLDKAIHYAFEWPGLGAIFSATSSAILENHPDAIHTILSDPRFDVNEQYQFWFRYTATHLGHAVFLNKVKCVSAILNCEADLNIVDGNGEAPLQIALKNNVVEIVMNLLLHGADSKKVFSPVRRAQVMGNTRELRELVLRRKVSEDDKVPELHMNTLKGDVAFVCSWLKGLTNKQDGMREIDGVHMPAAFYAIELGDPETTRVLLTVGHGLDPEAVEEALPVLVRSGRGKDAVEGENMWNLLQKLFASRQFELKKHFKGAEALLRPWCGTISALRFFTDRCDDFARLRSLCAQGSSTIYKQIDAEVGVSVLKSIQAIGTNEPTGGIRQDDDGLLPTMEYIYDESKGNIVGGDHEMFTTTSLTLVALSCSDAFDNDMRKLFSPITDGIHVAPPKSFGRMLNKLLNPAEHGDPSIRKPRPMKNVDVIRICIVVRNPKDVDAVFKALKGKYKVLRVKNSHDLTVGGEYRSFLVNFAYDSSLTYCEVFGNGHHDPDVEGSAHVATNEVGQAWLSYVQTRSPILDWQWGLQALWRIAQRQPERRVVVASEVQIIYKPYMDGRNVTHLLFKVARCETGPSEMARDFSPGFQLDSGDLSKVTAAKRCATKARMRNGTM